MGNVSQDIWVAEIMIFQPVLSHALSVLTISARIQSAVLIMTAGILNTVLWITCVYQVAEIMIFQPALWIVQPVLIMFVMTQSAVKIKTAILLNSVMLITFARSSARR
jgi:hypothetical protein